jgi:hypothetical protein|tara:strand:+ start:244 stop:519 length:276 start_codon:yes stop_codon:yes gene_type:complete
MSWSDTLKKSEIKKQIGLFELIERFEKLEERIRYVEEEMPLDIMSVLEDLYESKYYESVRQAANDLDNASGRPIDALPELEALIDALQRLD